MKYVVDTTVLIDHLRGRPQAMRLLEELVGQGHELRSPCIVRTEVLAGMRPGEEEKTLRLFGLLGWDDVTVAEADAAGHLGRAVLRQRPGIDAADLLIAELAQRLGATLLTTNVKHFPMLPGLEAAYTY